VPIIGWKKFSEKMLDNFFNLEYSRTMTYIWNRADRVDPKLMPEVVEDCFDTWVKKQMKGFNKLTEKEKSKVTFNIAKQLGQKNYNLTRLGYYKNK